MTSKLRMRLMIPLALFTLGGVVLAQQTQPKNVAPGEEVTLRAGEGAVVEQGTPEELLPKNCKTWNLAEIPGRASTIFICKEGKWTEYIQKDKISVDMIPKDKLAMLCAEADTEVSEPKPVTKTKAN